MATFRWLFLLACGCAAPMPIAAEIFQCGQGAVHRYQDVACAANETQRQWQPGVGQRSTRPTPALRRPTPSMQPRPRRPARPKPAAALIQLQQDPVGCRRMQLLREGALERARPRLDYVAQRGWDDRVRDACR